MDTQQVSLVDGGVQTISNIFGKAVDTGFSFLNRSLELDTLESELAIRRESRRTAVLLGTTGFENDIPGAAEAKENMGNTTKVLILGGLALAGTIAAIAAFR